MTGLMNILLRSALNEYSEWVGQGYARQVNVNGPKIRK